MVYSITNEDGTTIEFGVGTFDAEMNTLTRTEIHKPENTQMNDDWLLEQTGTPRDEWLLYLEKLIPHHSSPSDDPNHDVTDSVSVVEELSNKIMSRMPEDIDENMYLASVLSFILASWYVRVRRAKSFDPQRPVERRRWAHQQTTAFIGALAASMCNCSDDMKIWSGQTWENPFGLNPTDGTFV